MSLENQIEESAPEYSEVELKAMELGWNPEGVEGKDFIDAKTFVDRQPLYDDIKALKKQLKAKDRDYKRLASGVKEIREKAMAEAIGRLKAEKKEALDNQDHERVIQIDEEIADVKNSAVEPEVSSHYEDFLERNDWYQENDVMTYYANGIGTELSKQGLSEAQIFSEVEKRVKERFPEYFGKKSRKSADPVEGSTRMVSPSKQKYSKKDLPEEHLSIMKTLVRAGDITEEEYLKQYFGL